MRTLVVLAVMGVCSASYQAYNPAGYSHHSGTAQPKWVGPVAATVPAGVGGKVIPVGDTPEVSAARSAFFSAYQNQLAAVSGPHYGSAHSGPSYTHGAPAHAHAPARSYSVGSVHGPSSLFHAPAAPVHHVHAAPVHHASAASFHHVPAAPVHHVPSHTNSYGGHAAPVATHGYNGVPQPVSDTPEVAAAKAQFFRTFNKQAAAAAAAPDDYTNYH